ncbi:maleylpyruvate isomerase family mycothiol-dependent enzyme [Streptomyces sp. NPDC020681]|uniref:maleylpyruvate isomerase family mycothiol-dependent enzyme n=1 Tax=Streptomyces sp. NPDC020681 TaxID=3365083 RepID=UPI00379C5DF4
MDFSAHFRRETRAFEAAARAAAEGGEAPLVPSCPGWSMSDLIAHLGGVHLFVNRIVRDRLQQPPDLADVFAELPADREGWPTPETKSPHRGPVPRSLVDAYADGAATLDAHFRSVAPDESVWTWSAEQTVGFWLRMQTIEAALHRWDAEGALGVPQPVDTELAEDAVSQNFEVMAPTRRARQQPPLASGERYRFRQTDGTGLWTVHLDGDDIRLDDASGPCDVELSGTASDLMLFLWHRIPADRLDEVTGDRDVLDRYFTLVPPE